MPTGDGAATPRLVSVIDIGSTAIRLLVAEIRGRADWETLDRAARPLAVGRDVFRTGFISTDSMREVVTILKSYQELLRGWGITPDETRVIATAAVREARNRDTFLDRVIVRTGYRVDVIEGIEENQLTYRAVQFALEPFKALFARSSAMILEVGGGTTEIMLLQRGRMVAAHSLRIGTLRVEQQLDAAGSDDSRVEEYLRETIRVNRSVLNAELPLDRVRYFVAVGGDARIAADRVGRRDGDRHWIIERADFLDFLREISRHTVDECVRTLKLTYAEAEGLAAALSTYRIFLEATSAEQLIVPDVSIREGVLSAISGEDSEIERREFAEQVLNSARGLGRKYHFDETHGSHVATLAVSIFDQFRSEHGMERHARLLLETAAIVHDIGNFIRAAGHHKHGQYIVENSEIFGLSGSDIRIVANVVRYHRRGMPATAHTEYASLRREYRILVLKLSAILRVADALDRSHAQRVSAVRLEVRPDDVVLHGTYRGDITIEQHALREKGRMFEEVFGYRAVLR